MDLTATDRMNLTAPLAPTRGTARVPPSPLSPTRVTAGRGPWFQARDPAGFEWNGFDLPVPGLPPALDGLRILHLSDLHLRRTWYSGYEDLLTRIEAAPPDLLLVTGDFVDDKRNPRLARNTLRRFVSRFRARLGCFGVLGNHDRMHLVPHLARTNVTLLGGRRHVLTHRGASVELIGLPGAERPDLADAFLRAQPPRPPGALRIVLAHYPDQIRRVGPVLRPDLYLAGHTHGGQVCLPLPYYGFPLIRHDTLPRRQCKGVHRFDDTWLVVSRGYGFSAMPVRVFCPCEVIELRLSS